MHWPYSPRIATRWASDASATRLHRPKRPGKGDFPWRIMDSSGLYHINIYIYLFICLFIDTVFINLLIDLLLFMYIYLLLLIIAI
jgi:hypothetical protein